MLYTGDILRCKLAMHEARKAARKISFLLGEYQRDIGKLWQAGQLYEASQEIGDAIDVLREAEIELSRTADFISHYTGKM